MDCKIIKEMAEMEWNCIKNEGCRNCFYLLCQTLRKCINSYFLFIQYLTPNLQNPSTTFTSLGHNTGHAQSSSYIFVIS